MASGGAPLWDDDSKFNYAVYLGNGPTFDVVAGELEFENTPDENQNKTTGGRIGILPIPNLEVGGSWMTGKTSDRGRFELYGADFWYWIAGLELRGEYVRVDASPVSSGYYLQSAYRLNQYFTDPTGWSGIVARFEPVIRWGETKGKGPDNREQLGVGLNYWMFESVPLKFTYEFNEGGVDTDRLIFQIAYGF